MSEEWASNEGISRRRFLASAGAVAAGVAAVGALGGCSTPTDANTGSATTKYSWETPPAPIPAGDIVETVDCDIAIVGAGIAGCAGALKAADAGAKVQVLEKSGKVGNSREAAFAMNCKLQKDAGIQIPRAMRDSLISMYLPASSPVLDLSSGVQVRADHVTNFCDTSAEFMDWYSAILIDEGIDVHVEPEYGPVGISYGIAGNPPDPWNEATWKAAEKRGAKFNFLTSAVQLLQDASSRVIGVVAQRQDGKYVQYNARKGVILSCGGIGSDAEMMKVFFPHADRVTKNFCYPSHTGDGHKMGMWAGAEMELLISGDFFPASTTGLGIKRVGSTVDYHGFDDTWPAAPGIGQLPVLYVNKAGYRTLGEDQSLMTRWVTAIFNTGGVLWSIWDSAWEKKIGPMIPKTDVCTGASTFVTWFAMNSQGQIDADVERGITIKANTIDELAQKMKVDVDVLKGTIARYNELCAKGHDDDFNKAPEWMTTSVETGPFYAAQVGSGLCVTRGGLVTDGKSRVLKKDGTILRGLYAAGTTSGSVGGFYKIFSGCSLYQSTAWMAVMDALGIEPKPAVWPDVK